MVHFQFTSKELLTIRIVDDFSHSDTERIALFLESSFKEDYEAKINFQLETDVPKNQRNILNNFCQGLPYENRIDLKYPILIW